MGGDKGEGHENQLKSKPRENSTHFNIDCIFTILFI